MTPKKQVSPVIRISQGERDASARATHLEAASEKYSETTIERKQMSTTTNFKRIALVAVAALGLGVLSSVPSKAVINADSLVLSAATAAQTTAETYTATSAVVTASFFGAISDSITLTSALVSSPDGSTAVPVLRLIETSSAVIDTRVDTAGAGFRIANLTATDLVTNKKDSSTVALNVATTINALSSTVRTSAKYAVYLAQQTRTVSGPATAGTYVIKLTPAAVGVGPLVGSTAQTLTITVTTAATESLTLSAANTTAFMTSGSTDAKLQAADSTVVALKTADAAAEVANIWVTGQNAAKASPANIESITATITGAGTLGANASASSGGAIGRSILIKTNTDYVTVYADGNAGVGTITLTGSTSGTLIATKTVTFSGTVLEKFAAPTIAATDSTVITSTGSTTVSVLAQDAPGNLVSGLTTAGATIFAHSSDTKVVTVGAISGTPSATVGYSTTVSGVGVGEATITFGNASTLAASTVKSTGIKVRVGTNLPSSVRVTADKATYAPGERITLTVTILNAAGLPVVGATTYSDIFAAAMTTNMALSNTTPSLPGASISDYSNTTNTKTFVNNAPVTGGTLTFSWTGGTGLATANQVAGTLSVVISDSGALNAAAIASLQTAVASLRTLLVTLTNLVLKIQKKVKA